MGTYIDDSTVEKVSLFFVPPAPAVGVRPAHPAVSGPQCLGALKLPVFGCTSRSKSA